MVDKKTIGISSLITMGLIIVSLVGTSYFDSPKYYCSAKQVILECPGELSRGNATRCYLNSERTSWNTCSTGWTEITNDLNIQQDETIPKLDNQAYVQYSCNQEKCVIIQ